MTIVRVVVFLAFAGCGACGGVKTYLKSQALIGFDPACQTEDGDLYVPFVSRETGLYCPTGLTLVEARRPVNFVGGDMPMEW